MRAEESKLQLADRLIGIFNHLAGGEMPSRVVRCEHEQVRPKPGESDDWGTSPVVVIAIDGPASLRVEAVGDSVELRSGDAVLMTVRQLQAIKPGGHGKLVGFESLGTQPTRFFELDAAGGTEGRSQIEIFCAPIAGNIPECWYACHEIYCLLESARRYAIDTEGSAEPALRSVLRLAVIECARALQSFLDCISKPAERSNVARVMMAEAFVTCNIERDIRKVELAEFLGVSVSQLTLAFREVGQLAVRDRLRFRRVESARHLLADTSLSIAEVAECVGMNYRHFIRAFRQCVVLTPLRYRKYARQKEKSDEAWAEFFHTANFDRVQPLGSAPELSNGQLPPISDGAITVLISNGTDAAVTISRLREDGEFVDVGTTAAEKRLSFTDVPGSVWRVAQRGNANGGSRGKEEIFKAGESNSHLIFQA